MEVTRKPYWVYADISCAAYLLREVDTISDNGTINTYSALHLVVHGVIKIVIFMVFKKYLQLICSNLGKENPLEYDRWVLG